MCIINLRIWRTRFSAIQFDEMRLMLVIIIIVARKQPYLKQIIIDCENMLVDPFLNVDHFQICHAYKATFIII